MHLDVTCKARFLILFRSSPSLPHLIYSNYTEASFIDLLPRKLNEPYGGGDPFVASYFLAS